MTLDSFCETQDNLGQRKLEKCLRFTRGNPAISSPASFRMLYFNPSFEKPKTNPGTRSIDPLRSTSFPFYFPTQNLDVQWFRELEFIARALFLSLFRAASTRIDVSSVILARKKWRSILAGTWMRMLGIGLMQDVLNNLCPRCVILLWTKENDTQKMYCN